MWDSDIVEWYYPGLIPGESMVVVDRDTAQTTVRKLNENPELMTALAAGALRIDRAPVSPHCIADYLRRAFTSIRDETGLGEVVDDLGLVRRLAAENGTACDDFVEVIIRDRKTGADAVTSKPAVEAGDSLCNVLARGG